MKTRLLVAALVAAVAMNAVEAGLSKAQTTAINKAFASLPRAEFAAKASELVSKASEADKEDTALAALKAALAKAPATAPVVVSAIAQIAPSTAPAVAAAAARIAPSQADMIAKAAAMAAPQKAARIIMAVSQAVPDACGPVLVAVMRVVPSAVETGIKPGAARSRNTQALAGGGGTIATLKIPLAAIEITPSGDGGNIVIVVDQEYAALIQAVRETLGVPVSVVVTEGGDVEFRASTPHP